MKLTTLAIACGIIVAGCASPTAPTPAPPAIILGYAWDRIAPGCTPRLPLPAYTSRTPDRTAFIDPGTSRAFYLELTDRSQPGRTVETFTVGDFRWDGGWAICTWETMTRTVIAGR